MEDWHFIWLSFVFLVLATCALNLLPSLISAITLKQVRQTNCCCRCRLFSSNLILSCSCFYVSWLPSDFFFIRRCGFGKRTVSPRGNNLIRLSAATTWLIHCDVPNNTTICYVRIFSWIPLQSSVIRSSTASGILSVCGLSLQTQREREYCWQNCKDC